MSDAPRVSDTRGDRLPGGAVVLMRAAGGDAPCEARKARSAGDGCSGDDAGDPLLDAPEELTVYAYGD